MLSLPTRRRNAFPSPRQWRAEVSLRASSGEPGQTLCHSTKSESSDFIPGDVLQNFEAEHFPCGRAERRCRYRKGLLMPDEQEGFPELFHVDATRSSQLSVASAATAKDCCRSSAEALSSSHAATCSRNPEVLVRRYRKGGKEHGKGVGVLFMFKSMPYL